jgi:hypothetical protein
MESCNDVLASMLDGRSTRQIAVRLGKLGLRPTKSRKAAAAGEAAPAAGSASDSGGDGGSSAEEAFFARLDAGRAGPQAEQADLPAEPPAAYLSELQGSEGGAAIEWLVTQLERCARTAPRGVGVRLTTLRQGGAAAADGRDVGVPDGAGAAGRVGPHRPRALQASDACPLADVRCLVLMDARL